jgi:hypothetical protein
MGDVGVGLSEPNMETLMALASARVRYTSICVTASHIYRVTGSWSFVEKEILIVAHCVGLLGSDCSIDKHQNKDRGEVVPAEGAAIVINQDFV